MSYTCHYCEKEATNVRSFPVDHYQEVEDEQWEVLCHPCYDDWLLSLKG